MYSLSSEIPVLYRNTCIHSASHGTVNSVNTIRLPLPLCIVAPAAPLPPSLPRASQLAARALDGQIELVARAVGAVRVGVPLLHRRLVAGVLRLLFEVGGACIVAGRRPWQTCRGGEPNPACIHEYTVFSRVFSHGSNTRIIRVDTYSEYVFTT